MYADLDVAEPGVAEARTAMRVSGLQAGTDLLVTDTWRAGVYVGYLDGNADVSGNAHGIFNTAVGSNDLNSRFLGAYATWMDASGWYFDSVRCKGPATATTSDRPGILRSRARPAASPPRWKAARRLR